MLGWEFDMQRVGRFADQVRPWIGMQAVVMACLTMSLLGLAPPLRAEAMQDPTKPPAAVLPYLPGDLALAEQPWVLSALHAQGKAGFAIINGQTVHVGEAYEGYTLRAVTQRQALLVNKQGAQKRLSMATAGMTMTPVMAEGQAEAAVKPTRRGSKNNKQKLQHGSVAKPRQVQTMQ